MPATAGKLSNGQAVATPLCAVSAQSAVVADRGLILPCSVFATDYTDFHRSLV
jgi:hypothetical protein